MRAIRGLSFLQAELSLQEHSESGVLQDQEMEERNSAKEKRNWEKASVWFIYGSSCIALTINNAMKMMEFLISLTILLISGFKL